MAGVENMDGLVRYERMGVLEVSLLRSRSAIRVLFVIVGSEGTMYC